MTISDDIFIGTHKSPEYRTPEPQLVADHQPPIPKIDYLYILIIICISNTDRVFKYFN